MMETAAEHGGGGGAAFARGGPVYVPDSIGAITSVGEFKTAVVEALRVWFAPRIDPHPIASPSREEAPEMISSYVVASLP